VTRRGGMVTLVGEDVTPERVKGGDDASWTYINLTNLKNKENPRDRFSC
jgi:hypothetical protein